MTLEADLTLRSDVGCQMGNHTEDVMHLSVETELKTLLRMIADMSTHPEPIEIGRVQGQAKVVAELLNADPTLGNGSWEEAWITTSYDGEPCCEQAKMRELEPSDD